MTSMWRGHHGRKAPPASRTAARFSYSATVHWKFSWIFFFTGVFLFFFCLRNILEIFEVLPCPERTSSNTASSLSMKTKTCIISKKVIIYLPCTWMWSGNWGCQLLPEWKQGKEYWKYRVHDRSSALGTRDSSMESSKHGGCHGKAKAIGHQQGPWPWLVSGSETDRAYEITDTFGGWGSMDGSHLLCSWSQYNTRPSHTLSWAARVRRCSPLRNAPASLQKLCVMDARSQDHRWLRALLSAGRMRERDTSVDFGRIRYAYLLCIDPQSTDHRYHLAHMKRSVHRSTRRYRVSEQAEKSVSDDHCVCPCRCHGSEIQVLIAWEDLPFPTALANWMCI